MDSWVKLRHFNSQVEVELCKSYLESHGIQTLLKSEGSSGVHPSLVFAAGIELHVPQGQVDEARKILREADIRVVDDQEE